MVNSQADLLVSLEALRAEVVKIRKTIADIEILIYGNSKDTFDNNGHVSDTQDEIHTTIHTF